MYFFTALHSSKVSNGAHGRESRLCGVDQAPRWSDRVWDVSWGREGNQDNMIVILDCRAH